MSESLLTHRLLRVDPHQLGKVAGLIYGAFGILIGIIALLVGFLNPQLRGMSVFGIFAPVLYGGMGYLAAIIGAELFNWAAGRLGGVRMTFAVDTAEELRTR